MCKFNEKLCQTLMKKCQYKSELHKFKLNISLTI